MNTAAARDETDTARSRWNRPTARSADTAACPPHHAPAPHKPPLLFPPQLDRPVVVTLRDGRTLYGVLRSFDQYSNLVLEEVWERRCAPSRQVYHDRRLGLELLRGENLVLLGRVPRVGEAGRAGGAEGPAGPGPGSGDGPRIGPALEGLYPLGAPGDSGGCDGERRSWAPPLPAPHRAVSVEELEAAQREEREAAELAGEIRGRFDFLGGDGLDA